MRSIYAMFLINKDKSLKKVDKTKMINSDKKKRFKKQSDFEPSQSFKFPSIFFILCKWSMSMTI